MVQKFCSSFYFRTPALLHKVRTAGDRMSQKPEDGIIIKIKVETRSSRARIIGPYGDALKVKLTSAPIEGKANRELIELLAKGFGITKRDVRVLSGLSSKNKLVKLYGVSSADDWE
jgi:uncharacterized protein (TIGR00251 family)